jgi:hypothetical protein
VLSHSAWNADQVLGKRIYGHNLVRLLHPETNSYLFAGLSFEGDVPEVVLKRHLGTESHEAASVIRFNQINTIWEIVHFCKIFQGSEFTTGQGRDSQNRVLLRHFNSGKILAISSQNLPYLQDFNDSYAKEEASYMQSSARGKKEGRLEMSGFNPSRRELVRDVEAREDPLLPLQGHSVGASRSRSASSESKGKDESMSEGRDEESQDEKDLFDFRVEDGDSFAEEEADNLRHDADHQGKIPTMGSAIFGQTHKRPNQNVDEPDELSLAQNDPPVIKKKPQGNL